MGDQNLVVRLCQFQFSDHIELTLTRICRSILILGFGGVATDEFLRAEGLEFDRICARAGGNVDQLRCHFHVPVMVHASLSNDEYGQVSSYAR